MIELHTEYQRELLAFCAGYLVILATPGPNFVAIASTAAERGVRGSLPLVAGLTLGAGGTGAILLCLAAAGEVTGAWWIAGQVVAGGILIRAARKLLVGRRGHPGGSAPGRGMAILFLAGVAISSSNPITLAYFSSAALGPLGGAAGSPSVAVAAIVFLTLLRSLGVAGVAGSAYARRAFCAHGTVLRVGGAVLLAALGATMLRPCIELLPRVV